MTCPMCDPEGYREAMWTHAEAHDEAGTDSEWCDSECAYWPNLPECDCGVVPAAIPTS